MFTSFQKLLPKTINRLGLQQQVMAALICERYRRYAPALIHKNILFHSTPKFFRRGTLTIACENSVWASEITLKRMELLKTINQNIKNKPLQRIKTVIDAGLTDEKRQV